MHESEAGQRGATGWVGDAMNANHAGTALLYVFFNNLLMLCTYSRLLSGAAPMGIGVRGASCRGLHMG